MDFKFTEEQEKFRKEVRDFLEGEIKAGTFKPACDAWIAVHSPEFAKKVAAKGWIGLTWPKEFGGKGRSHVDRLILTEEMLRYGAPAGSYWFADRQIGSSILKFGTEEQKKELLPKIISGEGSFGLGMSEPEAGSDLASLQTKATEDGDNYIINGQKVWTSGAHFMNYIYLVARTDPTVPKHKGISEFIVATNLPGITIRPLVDITGGLHFNEVFFDAVKVPKKDLIGVKNRGFYQILEQLDYERSGMERLMANFPLFQGLVKYCKDTRRNGKPLCQDPIIRSRLAQLQIDFEVGRLLTYRVASVMEQGKAPNYEAAMAKAYDTVFEQRLAGAAIEILGLYGQLVEGSKLVPIEGMASYDYLMSQGYSLQAGTTEVLRNVIAQRGLGLPSQ
ncbi:MAG: acyl-CoA dehydrogenase family protein [Dehalococcoidales bacterium]|nr:acyl-CoA dehydrogenase family protein [Dehalococcoidales bacterium]